MGIDNIKIIRIPFAGIWQKLSEDCTPITDHNGNIIKLQCPDGKILTYTSLGKLIQEQLFGKKERWRENEIFFRGYSWSIDELEKLKTFVPSVPSVPSFKQTDTKNQTNLIINETNSAEPQNTPKNDGLNPQKPGTPGTDKIDDPNQTYQVDGIADMYKSEASP